MAGVGRPFPQWFAGDPPAPPETTTRLPAPPQVG